ncbi:hypothetical protein ACU4GI_12020 [Cupriavidus basilensis]
MHCGIASAIARICQAIVHDTDLILTVGIVHAEVEGVPEICVSLPMVVNGGGAQLLDYPEPHQLFWEGSQDAHKTESGVPLLQ